MLFLALGFPLIMQFLFKLLLWLENNAHRFSCDFIWWREESDFKHNIMDRWEESFPWNCLHHCRNSLPSFGSILLDHSSQVWEKVSLSFISMCWEWTIFNETFTSINYVLLLSAVCSLWSNHCVYIYVWARKLLTLSKQHVIYSTL